MSTKRRLTPGRSIDWCLYQTPKSPDGKRIAYVRTVIDEKTKEYRSQIWITSTCGTSKPRPFTSGPKTDSSPRWSPDGKKLPSCLTAAATARFGSCRLRAASFSATKMRRGASRALSGPRRDAICFTALVNPDDSPEDIQKPMDNKAREEERKKKQKNRPWLHG